MWSKIKNFFKNKWVKFSIATIIYVLWFVVWTRNPWMLFGVLVIYDIYISKFMYRLFWRKHKEQKAKSRPYRRTMEWVEAILFATVVATLIRIFLFEMYVIPSSSMEKTLLVGDYLCVSKVAYGPKMPNTPISFPFVHHTMPFSNMKKSFSEVVKLPYDRLCGFGKVKRGDAVVFNFPAGDTVLLEMQGRTYYDVLREYQANYGEHAGRMILNQHYHVASRPADKRENYIKRCIALPGDSLEIVHSLVYVNGEPFRKIKNMEYAYFVRTDGTLLNRTLQGIGVSNEDLGISKEDMQFSYGRYVLSQTILPLTETMVGKMEQMRSVTGMQKYEAEETDLSVFPNDERYSWTGDNFGPLWIPSKGATVALTPDNLPLYRRIIEVYEGNTLTEEGGDIIINGTVADSYTFKMDYYFMMGDNRHNSADSRFWGFVPEDHVVGKASFVWLSLDKDKGWFSGKIRWRQMFGKID